MAGRLSKGKRGRGQKEDGRIGGKRARWGEKRELLSLPSPYLERMKGKAEVNNQSVEKGCIKENYDDEEETKDDEDQGELDADEGFLLHISSFCSLTSTLYFFTCQTALS